MIDLITSLFSSKITLLLIDVVAIYLAVLVYRDNPKSKVNVMYLMMTFLMLLWVNAAYIPRFISQDNIQLGFTFLRIAWFATPLFFACLYLLTVYLVDKGDKYKILNTIVLILGVVSALITAFTTRIVEGIEFVDGIMTIVYGSWMFPFLGIVLFIMVATLVPIFREKR